MHRQFYTISACVPSPSYAHRSWLFTPHAPTSWHPVSSRLFTLFMMSCMHSSLSRCLFAQRMILELVCSWARHKHLQLQWGCFFFNFWDIGTPLHQERQWCPHTQRSSCHHAQHSCNCEQNLPYLFFTPNLSEAQLCVECLHQVLMAYIKFESDIPFSYGLNNSILLGTQSALYTAVKSKCLANFLTRQPQIHYRIFPGLVGWKILKHSLYT